MASPIRWRDRAWSFAQRRDVRWVLLALVAAGVLVTAVSSYREIDAKLTAVALARRETVAQLVAVTLAEKFERMADVAVSLATRVRVQELVAERKWTEAIDLLRDVPRDLPHIERLFLADTRGTLRADVPALPNARGVNFAAREWFQGVSREWRPYLTSVYIRAAEPRLNVFAVAAPLRNPTGAVTGILVLQIRVEKLVEWVGTANLGLAGMIYIVDAKKQLAFHSRRSLGNNIPDLSTVPVVERVRRGWRGVEIAYDPVEREDAIVAYAPVPGYGWGVVAQQPTHASLGLAARDQELRRLVTGYGLLILLGTVAIFLASRVAVERHRAEDDRRMKAELEQRVTERTAQLDAANKELEAFSYSVSHDLRALLRSIDGFSQALLEDSADRLDDVGRQHLARVRAATVRMAELIDDLLQLSRVTRAEMRREIVDLSALAESVVADLRRAEFRHQAEVLIQPGLETAGDPRLLRIALVNLLSNAWKFTGRQPSPRIELGGQVNGPERTFFVRDNGVGFDMAYADKLFGAFQRLHAMSEFPGTGIGLAIVQRIFHRHGGRVWAEGTVNEGATFYFALPTQPTA